MIKMMIDAGMGRVLLTSGDTAVDPSNPMGTTNLLAEMLVNYRPLLN